MKSAIVERLRNETRGLHERVEAPFASLLGETPNRALYARFLGAMWCFHRAFEPHGKRAAAIANDARDLALTLPEATCDAPILDTPSRRFGAAYVIEGSALGGRVLYRHLAPRLDLRPDMGARFLFGDGDRTVARFREFVDALDEHIAEGGDECAVVAGAIDTFACLARLLDA